MSLLGTLGRGALAVSTFGTSEAAKYAYDKATADGAILGKNKVTDTPALNPDYFQYGGGPNSAGANNIAGAQLQAGYQQQDAQNQLAGAMFNGANSNFDIANAAQLRGPQQIQGSAADKAQQLAALGYQGNAIGNLNNAGNTLTALGTRPMGDSYAAAQLKQGQDTAMAQQLAMARSGRSLGSGQAALDQAGFNNAAIGQQTNQAAASARIQEQNAYNQFQVGALGAAGQQYGAAGALGGQYGNQATQIRTGDENLQLNNANLALQQGQLNNATTGIYSQLGSQQLGYGMQANNNAQQAGQFGQGEAAHTMDQQLGANEALATGNTAITSQNNQAHDAATNSYNAMWRNAAADTIKYGATAAAASDERTKTNIEPLGPELPRITYGPNGTVLPVNSPPPPPPGYADLIRGYSGQAAQSAQYPVDVLNRVPGTGVGPSASQSALIAAFQRPPKAPLGMPEPLPLFNQPHPYVQAQAPSGSPQMASGALAPLIRSDVHSKTRIKQLESQLAALGGSSSYPTPRAPDTATLDQAAAAPPAIDLRPAQGYAYDYKNPSAPGAAPGRQVGVMAQDLERSPATAHVVHDTPHGKQVDTGRLALVNTAAISELQRKLQMLEAMGGGQQQPAAYDAGLYPQTQAAY